MDITILSMGRIYRERDIHVKAPNGKIAIISPCYFGKGVDVIDALKCQQRRGLPVNHKSLLGAVNSITDKNELKMSNYRFLTLDGRHIRMV